MSEIIDMELRRQRAESSVLVTGVDRPGGLSALNEQSPHELTIAKSSSEEATGQKIGHPAMVALDGLRSSSSKRGQHKTSLL